MYTALANAPTRATTSINLAWGPLMVIPCSVYTGTEPTRVERKEFFDADPNVPVGRSAVRKDTGEVIDTASVVRMAQAQNGTWVPLSDDEIAACTTFRGLAEILCFVKNAKVSQYLTEDVKQVRPKREKGKVNPAAEKAFALLLAGMAAKKVHALIKVAMRGPARYALLDSKGNLSLIYSADQIRNMVDLPTVEATPQELELAGKLIDMIGTDAPVLTDTTAPNVRTYVDNKAAGYITAAVEAPAPSNIDLVQQMLASIEAKKAS